MYSHQALSTNQQIHRLVRKYRASDRLCVSFGRVSSQRLPQRRLQGLRVPALTGQSTAVLAGRVDGRGHSNPELANVAAKK